MDEQKILGMMLGMLDQVKMFHWSTMSYPKHVALDTLHGTLSGLVDRFVEAYIGRFKKQPLKPFSVELVATTDPTSGRIAKFLEGERDKLIALRKGFEKTSSALQNILDEMTSAIDQTLYLLNLS